MKKITRYQ